MAISVFMALAINKEVFYNLRTKKKEFIHLIVHQSAHKKIKMRSTHLFTALTIAIATAILGITEAHIFTNVIVITQSDLTIEICEEPDDSLYDFIAIVTCNSTKPVELLPTNRMSLQKSNQTRGTDWTFESCEFSKNFSMKSFMTSLGLNKTRSLRFKSTSSLPNPGNLKGLSVESLSLIANNVSSLDQELLYDMHLEDMDINDMPLNSLPEKFFENSKDLQSLDLLGTKLKSIKTGDFQTLSNLRDLLLYNNTIEEIEVGAFDKTTKLNILSIYFEPLKTIHANIFDKLTNLIELEICSTQLTEIPSQLLRSQKNSLVQLRMNNNEKLRGLPPNLLINSNNLVFIELEHNNFTSLPADIFANVPSLKTLNLSVNKLKALPENLFKNNRELQQLSVRENELTSFPTKVFENTNITRVYLDSNNITHLPFEFISWIKNDVELYLEGNQIRTLHFTWLEKYAKSIPENKKVRKASIYLQDNPLDCNCDILLYMERKLHKRVYDLVSFPDGLNCKNSSVSKNQTRRGTSMKDVRCSTRKQI
ncbi:hypothetical protein QAD02_006927 [Eretmocerus hayati]|uniref:Uncharacterized protein n=1 Tax=Eretmocerus hayati TaxID=131215 RepID=A0ACC2N6M2_9HYME|nr:hypothetical protein QAD02_006927 [Eretmocerus hayati]